MKRIGILLVGTPPLALRGVRAALIEAAFIATTVLLPIVAHLAGLPVLRVLPMFWGVFLAGAVYGWRGGLIVGLTAPVINHLLTGMPPTPMVVPMTLELAVYGALPALVADRAPKVGLWGGILIAAVVGRVVVTVAWVALVGGPDGLSQFIRHGLMPGVAVQLLQVALIPIVGAGIKRLIATNRPEDR